MYEFQSTFLYLIIWIVLLMCMDFNQHPIYMTILYARPHDGYNKELFCGQGISCLGYWLGIYDKHNVELLCDFLPYVWFVSWHNYSLHIPTKILTWLLWVRCGFQSYSNCMTCTKWNPNTIIVWTSRLDYCHS
jgi:hypothetical protein